MTEQLNSQPLLCFKQGEIFTFCWQQPTREDPSDPHSSLIRIDCQEERICLGVDCGFFCEVTTNGEGKKQIIRKELKVNPAQ